MLSILNICEIYEEKNLLLISYNQGIILFILQKFWFLLAGIPVAVNILIYCPERNLDALDVLNHTTRQKIMDILNEQAEHGETFKKLSQTLHVPTPTLIWHLKMLEEFSFIQIFKIHREIVIVAQEFVRVFDPIQKEFELSFTSLQAQLFKTFILNLYPCQEFTVKEVSTYTHWNIKTAQRHLNHLCKLGILRVNTNEKRVYNIDSRYIMVLKHIEESEI